MRGRKPKPEELKRLAGYPGRRKPRKVIQPAPDLAGPPEWLAPAARREWDRVAPELERLKLLSVLDRAGLAIYCDAFARWSQLAAKLAGKGMTRRTAKGYVYPAPEVALMSKFEQVMRAWASEFGFTPASRSRWAGQTAGKHDQDQDRQGEEEYFGVRPSMKTLLDPKGLPARA